MGACHYIFASLTSFGQYNTDFRYVLRCHGARFGFAGLVTISNLTKTHGPANRGEPSEHRSEELVVGGGLGN